MSVHNPRPRCRRARRTRVCPSGRAAALFALYCALGALNFGELEGSGTAVGAGSEAPTCADMTPATNGTMMEKSGGELPDCLFAKVIKLCARDPVMAAAASMCPVTCALGCGNSSNLMPNQHPDSAADQLFIPDIPAAFANCSVATVAALLDEINEACCTNQDCSAAGFKCTPHCGAAVVPWVRGFVRRTGFPKVYSEFQSDHPAVLAVHIISS